MRLKKKQKAALLEWITEGLQTDEINKRAAVFAPPFSVSRSQVGYYRETREVDIDAIKLESEMAALTTGLARKEIRVQKLIELAALMEKDLFGGLLWVENVKGIGSGNAAQIIEYEEFNKAEVDSYRGVLDDIAKEVGGRVQRQEQHIDITSVKDMTDDELRAIINSGG